MKLVMGGKQAKRNELANKIDEYRRAGGTIKICMSYNRKPGPPRTSTRIQKILWEI